MGYYSEVAIQCERGAYEMLEPLIEMADPDTILHNVKKDVFQLRWDWTKWDDCFDEIKGIEDCLDYFDQEYDGQNQLGYGFIRLGEFDSDIEQRTNCDDLYMWVTRDVGTDYTFEEQLK